MIIKTFEQFLQVLKLQSLADREEEEVNSVSLNLLKPAGVEMFCRTSSECRWGRLTSCLCLCLRCGCVSWTGITTTAFIPSATWRTPRSASVSDSASSDQTSGMFVMSKLSPVLTVCVSCSHLVRAAVRQRLQSGPQLSDSVSARRPPHRPGERRRHEPVCQQRRVRPGRRRAALVGDRSTSSRTFRGNC